MGMHVQTIPLISLTRPKDSSRDTPRSGHEHGHVNGISTRQDVCQRPRCRRFGTEPQNAAGHSYLQVYRTWESGYFLTNNPRHSRSGGNCERIGRGQGMRLRYSACGGSNDAKTSRILRSLPLKITAMVVAELAGEYRAVPLCSPARV